MSETTDLNKYLITGTRHQLGAIGVPDRFSEEIEAPSSREAYLTILNDPNHEHIHVTAIKMKLNGTYHLTVDPNLYLQEEWL